MNSLQLAISACVAPPFLTTGNCLIPLIDLLKKPKAKWAKKNYEGLVDKALDVLIDFIKQQPDNLERPTDTADASLTDPLPPPRHPNMFHLLTEMTKPKKSCKIKGVEKFVLNLSHKDLAIALKSLEAIDIIVTASQAIDAVTKIPKGKKQVLLDLPLAKEKKGLLKNLATGTIKSLAKLLSKLLDAPELNDAAITKILGLMTFCTTTVPATATKHLIAAAAGTTLLRLLPHALHRESALPLLSLLQTYGEPGAKALSAGTGMTMIEECVKGLAGEVASQDTDPATVPALLTTISTLLTLQFAICNYIDANPTAKLKFDDADEVSTVPSPDLVSATTLTLNTVLNLSPLPVINPNLTLYTTVLVKTVSILGCIAGFDEPSRTTVLTTGTLPLLLPLLTTPKMITDGAAQASKKEEKKGKKKGAEPDAIAAPVETPRDGNPIGYDLRRVAEKAVCCLVVVNDNDPAASDVADETVLRAGDADDPAPADGDAPVTTINIHDLITAMGSTDRDVAARAIRVCYVMAHASETNAKVLGTKILPSVVQALRWTLETPVGAVDAAPADVAPDSPPLPSVDSTKISAPELTIMIASLIQALAADPENCVTIGTSAHIALISTPLTTASATVTKDNARAIFAPITVRNPLHTMTWNLQTKETTRTLRTEYVAAATASCLKRLCVTATIPLSTPAPPADGAATDEAPPASTPNPAIPAALLCASIGGLPALSLLGLTVAPVVSPTHRRPLWGTATKRNILPIAVHKSLLEFIGDACTVDGGKLGVVGAAFKEGWAPASVPVPVVVVSEEATDGKKMKAKGKKKKDAEVVEPVFEPTATFVSFDDLTREVDEADVATRKAAWPYARVVSVCLACIMFPESGPKEIVECAVGVLGKVVRDSTATNAGEGGVVADVLAGVAMGMGAGGALVELGDVNKFRYEEDAFSAGVIEEVGGLVDYLVGRGAERERYWAEKPMPVVKKEEVVPAKKAPAKGKKGKDPEPEQEEEKKDEPEPILYGVPDPNEGPTRDQWASLLNVACVSSLNSYTNVTPLLASVCVSNAPLTSLLLSCGASPNVSTTDNVTPLILAVAQGEEEIARALIEKGANMDAIGPNGASALKFAFCVPPKEELLRCCDNVRKPVREEPSGPVNMKPRIVIAGAPASGKGEQAAAIARTFGVVHLSTGDMLRAEVKEMTDIGLEIQSYMESGDMVPDEVLLPMVEERIKDADCVERGWLLDGFPRLAKQAAKLEEFENGQADMFIQLDVADELLVERATGRRKDPVTGKVYHLVTNPPENEEIAARLEQRPDDNEETVKVRLALYHENAENVRGIYDGTYVYVAPDPLAETDEGYTTGGYTTDEGGLGESMEGLQLDEEPVKEQEQEQPETEQEQPVEEAPVEEAPVEEASVEEAAEVAPVVSRVTRIDGARPASDVAEDVIAAIRKATNWGGIPTEDEIELAGASLKIQGVFRTRQAKKKAAKMKFEGVEFDESKAQVVSGLPSLVEFLISKGADVNISDDEGNFPLHWALMGATVDFKFRGVKVMFKGPMKDQSLVDLLSESGADLDVCNKNGQTLLHTALNSGDTTAALRLLGAGAHPNAMDNGGLLPIHHACMSASPGFDELVTVLLASGNGRGIMVATHKDNRKGKSKQEKLLLTLEGIMDGDYEEAICPASITQRLVDKREILQLVTKEGFTALHYAAGAAGDSDGDLGIESRVSLLEKLLKDDAVDVNVADVHPPGAGATALHCSIKMIGSLELVKVLLREKIKVDALEDVGDGSDYHLTALHYALKSKHVEIAEYLLENGASTQCVGANPPLLTWVVEQGNKEGLELVMLKSSEVDGQFVNVKDGEGRTALHLAVGSGNLEFLELLLNAPNVDVGIKDGRGATALHDAVKRGDGECVKLLLKYGAGVRDVDGDGFSVLECCVESLFGDTLSMLGEVLDKCELDDVVGVKGGQGRGVSLLQMVEHKVVGMGEEKRGVQSQNFVKFDAEDGAETAQEEKKMDESVMSVESGLTESSLEVGEVEVEIAPLMPPRTPGTPGSPTNAGRRRSASNVAVDTFELTESVCSLLLQKFGDRVEVEHHVHECFGEGMMYYEWCEMKHREKAEKEEAERAEQVKKLETEKSKVRKERSSRKSSKVKKGK